MYLEGGAARESVKFNPAAMIDAKLKVLAWDASTTGNAKLARIVEIARDSFFGGMIDGSGNLIQGTYDKTMRAWSGELDKLMADVK
jgi:hypothetical protein